MNLGVVDFRNSVEFSMFISLAGEVMIFIGIRKFEIESSKIKQILIFTAYFFNRRNLRPELSGTLFAKCNGAKKWERNEEIGAKVFDYVQTNFTKFLFLHVKFQVRHSLNLRW